jgi:CubicO group peptidase (beta-lactamase class C family)
MRFLSTTALATLLIGPWVAPESLAESSRQHFARFLKPYVSAGDFDGSVLVAKRGRLLFRQDYGKLNYELNIDHGPQSRFHIASLTKTFTAAAVLILEREGKLALSDPLSKYLPGYPNGDKITLGHLLDHSSGLRDYYSLSEYPDLRRKRTSLPELISLLRTKPLDFEPGTQHRYSNTGYAYLAYVIEKVTGKPYGRFIQEELFVPAGMRNSGTWSDEALIPFRASGYQPWVGPAGLRNAPPYDKAILTGSGSLYSTAEDLWAWYRFIRSNPRFDLRAAPYPFGWGVRKSKDHSYIEQNGRDPGFVAHMAAFLDDDLVIIVLSNVEVASDTAIVNGLAAIAFGGEASAPAPRPAYAMQRTTLNEYTGRYEVAPDLSLDVEPAGDHLFLRGTGGDFLPLDATDRDAFFYRQLYVKVVFQRDESGKVKGLLWDGEYPCKRVGDVPKEETSPPPETGGESPA